MSDNIYKQLYDITQENITNAGIKFVNQEQTFLYYCENDPHVVDIGELMKTDASNEEFIQLVYLALLNRPIDPDSCTAWAVLKNMNQTEYRINAVYSVFNSPETSVCHKRIYNNIPSYYHENDSIAKKQNLFLRGAYKVYRHCPQPVKTIFKKTAGRFL